MPIKKSISCISILIAVSMCIFSQSSTSDTIMLNELLVTGSKVGFSKKTTPLSVSYLSKNEIENTGQINVLTALNTYIPGIFVTSRNVLGFGVATGGSGAISMRGIGNSPNTGVLVLVDGQPHNQGLFGHPLADTYVQLDVAKVAVIRGPGSLLYGSNAMGGVINIITRNQASEGLSGKIGGAYGSYNTQKYFGSIGMKIKNFSAFTTINRDKTDGTRPNTDFRITNSYSKFGYKVSPNLNVTADVSIARYDANDNGSVYSAIPNPFNIAILRGKTSLSLTNKFRRFEGNMALYHTFGKHQLSDGFISNDQHSGALIHQKFKLSKNNLMTVGIDFKQFGGRANKGINKDTLIFIQELACYVYGQQTLWNKFTLSAGMRIENNSKYGRELVPMGGLSYSPTNHTTLKFNANKGFRSPTVMEMYMYAPNPYLLPERMMNYELSWLQSLKLEKLDFEISAYQVKGENMIHIIGQGQSAKRQNIGSFENYGFEIAAKFAVSKNLTFNANYSYLELSKPVIAAPREQANFVINYIYKNWNFHTSAQYIEKLYTSINPNAAINPIIQPNYLLLNARVAYKPVSRFEIYILTNNLLNQRYQINYGYPMPQINVHSGISYTF